MDDIQSITAGYDNDIAVVDLHVCAKPSEAIEKLDHAISRYLTTEQYIRVIYGVGTGRLSKAVRDHLDNSAYVTKYTEEPSGGSAIVFF